MNKKITVIGSSNIDFIMKMKRLPKVGETVTEANFMQTFGGKGANQAVAASRAGGDVIFVSAVGDDKLTDEMLNNFVKDKMNIDYVFRQKNMNTGAALIMIGEGGNNYLSVAPEANYKLTPESIESAKKAIEVSEIVVLQYETPEETLKYIIDTCTRLNKKVMWNFAPARNFDMSYIGKTSILVVNETEAEFLTNQKVETDSEVEKAAQTLLNKGVETAIITLGVRGSYLTNATNKEFLPAFKVEAVDTTAAGDTYCGSLAVALVEGKSFKEAIRFAAAASAISVTRMGAQPSAPTRKEIEKFLQQNK